MEKQQNSQVVNRNLKSKEKRIEERSSQKIHRFRNTHLIEADLNFNMKIVLAKKYHDFLNKQSYYNNHNTEVENEEEPKLQQ